MSFATGYTSHSDKDNINPEECMSVGQQMNKVLDNKPYETTMEIKHKVKPLSHLRDAPVVDGEKVVVHPLKLFNRLVLIAERNECLRDTLFYELTVVPLSLFDDNLFMRKNKKSALGKQLKTKATPSRRPAIAHRVMDGGWMLHQVKWREGDTWQEIAEAYASFISTWSIVDKVPTTTLSLFCDGYKSSTKDHEH